MRKIKILFVLLVVFLLVISCGNKKEVEKTEKIKVTTTINFFQDLVSVIGGDKVEVLGIMGEGEDPHLYNAKPQDLEKLSNADLIVYGGLHLEGKMVEIFEKLEKEKKVLNLSNFLDPNLIKNTSEGTHDPHVWFDSRLWAQEAKAVYEKLSEIDEKNKDYYKENYEKYIIEIDKMTEYVQNKINEIPENQRKLITAHDAFQYFAAQYGLEVKAIQGISTDSETGTKNISDLAEYIVENKIKAIFIESSVPKKSIEALQEAVKAKGFNVEIGGELSSDSMEKPSYIESVKANADTISNALK